MTTNDAVLAERERCSAIFELAASIEGRGPAAARSASMLIRNGVSVQDACSRLSELARGDGEIQLLAQVAERFGVSPMARSTSTRASAEPRTLIDVMAEDIRRERDLRRESTETPSASGRSLLDVMADDLDDEVA